MSLLSQLVDPQTLARLDYADFGRLEALTTGMILRDSDQKKKLEASAQDLLKSLPRTTP